MATVLHQQSPDVRRLDELCRVAFAPYRDNESVSPPLQLIPGNDRPRYTFTSADAEVWFGAFATRRPDLESHDRAAAPRVSSGPM